MVTLLPTVPIDGPAGIYHATPAPAGGFRLEITVRNGGKHPLVDFYQETTDDHEPGLLHPHEAPPPFRPCPSSGAPGWTSVGVGLMPGAEAGPFIAWCAFPPAGFSMRWCAEDPEIGGAFEIVAAPG